MIKNKAGESTLMIAVKKQNLGAIIKLINVGANVELKDNFGMFKIKRYDQTLFEILC